MLPSRSTDLNPARVGNPPLRPTASDRALRRLASTEPEAEDLNQLVAELLDQGPDFSRLWQRYDIEHYAQGQVELNHPIVGKITPAYQVMRLDGTDGLTMMTFHAAADSPELTAFHTLDRLPAVTG